MDPKKILIVEDEKPLSRALTLKLTSSGYQVEVAEDGQQAMDKISSGNYDLILMDLVMPTLDGFSVLEFASQQDVKTPIVVTSNLGQQEDVSRAKTLGVTDYLIKSNTPLTAIVSTIEHILQS